MWQLVSSSWLYFHNMLMFYRLALVFLMFGLLKILHIMMGVVAGYLFHLLS